MSAVTAVSRRAGIAVVEATLAAAAVAMVETTRALITSSTPFDLGTWCVATSLACLAAIAAAIGLAGVAAAVARIPAVARWTGAIAAGAGKRSVAVWRATVLAVATAIAASVVYVVVNRTHEAFRFIDGGPVGLVVAGVLTPVLLAFVLIVLAIDRRIVARIADADLLAGWRIKAVAAAAAVVIAIGPMLAMLVAAPAVDRDAVDVVALLVVAVGVLRLAHVGRRGVAQIGALAVVIVAIAGTTRLGVAERARGLAVVHGVFARVTVRAIWAVADSDGDGYARESVGGADCDDDDPLRNPRAIEIAGNGIDENCTGADAPKPVEPAPHAPVAPTHHNIVLISIDALRADHLGAYGYPRKTSAALDAFAATATRFEWALTSCPSTRCAIPSLFTGRFWSPLHASRAAGGPSLASKLREAGYDTAAVMCCGRFALGDRELDGFTTVDVSPDATRLQRPGQSNSDAVTDATLDWLRRRGTSTQPYALWIHYYDPHHPYQAPDAADHLGTTDLDRYDAEIVYTDVQIGRLLGMFDPGTTVVAITADHGEEFGEHGVRFHARSLFNGGVRIPLVVRAPGGKPGVVATPVSIVDVMPTLLELAGVEAPRGINGVSLAPALAGGAAPARGILMELVPDTQISHDAAALVHGRWKVIWDRDANYWSLFELADAGETVDRSRDEPTVLADMKRRLFEALDRELAIP
ncbi:MAG: sulfatase-like hydrolase/transferase [Kofleriaceae bacterium]